MLRRTLQVNQGELVFLVVIVTAFASVLIAVPELLVPPQVLPLFGLGLLYTALGVVGFRSLSETSPPHLLVGYFVTQVALGAMITYLSRGAGAAWLLLMPIVGQSVLLPRWATLVVCVSIVGLFGFNAAVLAGWWAAAEASVSYLAGVVFVVVLTTVAVREERARAEVEQLAAQLQHANGQLAAYAAEVERLATMEERNRVAREIHDSLGHYLTTIHVQIAAARAVRDDRGRADDALGKAQLLAQQGLHEVRRSVTALRALPVGYRALPVAITALVAEAQSAGLHVALLVEGEPQPLNPLVELACYRVAQEGLTNIRRHACARQAEIVLDYRCPELVRLQVCDDGVGSVEATGGFGLLGVQERVRQLGGAVTIRTSPGHGFVLELEVPR